MKIHSKFKDYYDIGLAYGEDENVHYARKTVELDIPEHIQEKFQNAVTGDSFSFRNNWISNGFVIGYCGKISVGIKNTYGIKPVHYYTEEAYRKTIYKKSLPEYLNSNRYYYSKNLRKVDIINFFNLNKILTQQLQFMFVELGVPLFALDKIDILGDRKLILNPRLNEYEFAKVVDPYTMFQEVSMFVSGVLGTCEEPDPSNVADKYMKYQKGFDDWSFKKLPSKKR